MTDRRYRAFLEAHALGWIPDHPFAPQAIIPAYLEAQRRNPAAAYWLGQLAWAVYGWR